MKNSGPQVGEHLFLYGIDKISCLIASEIFGKTDSAVHQIFGAIAFQGQIRPCNFGSVIMRANRNDNFGFIEFAEPFGKFVQRNVFDEAETVCLIFFRKSNINNLNCPCL